MSLCDSTQIAGEEPKRPCLWLLQMPTVVLPLQQLAVRLFDGKLQNVGEGDWALSQHPIGSGFQTAAPFDKFAHTVAQQQLHARCCLCVTM